MKLRIGISPCPNDTFIFEAISSGKIHTSPYEFDFLLKDVEELNELALKGELDIVKISYAHYLQVMPNYIMLRSGGAMGKGVGPLLVSKNLFPLHELSDKRIALPGEHTTAHFLFTNLFPLSKKKFFRLFSTIEEAVRNDEVDAGVIIHEGRFTYASKGLKKLADLGELWQHKINLPLPLGGIAIRRNLEKHHAIINDMIRNSTRYAIENYQQTLPGFVKDHAQEMSEDVMRQHIQLYVNEFSLDVGTEGMKAVEEMLDLSTSPDLPIFVK